MLCVFGEADVLEVKFHSGRTRSLWCDVLEKMAASLVEVRGEQLFVAVCRFEAGRKGNNTAQGPTALLPLPAVTFLHRISLTLCSSTLSPHLFTRSVLSVLFKNPKRLKQEIHLLLSTSCPYSVHLNIGRLNSPASTGGQQSERICLANAFFFFSPKKLSFKVIVFPGKGELWDEGLLLEHQSGGKSLETGMAEVPELPEGAALSLGDGHKSVLCLEGWMYFSL